MQWLRATAQRRTLIWMTRALTRVAVRWERCTAKVSMSGRMATDSRVTSKTVKSTDTDATHGQTATFTKETSRTANRAAWELHSTLTSAMSTKANGRTAS